MNATAIATASSHITHPHAIDWNAIWNRELFNHWEVYGKRSGAGQWHSETALKIWWEKEQ